MSDGTSTEKSSPGGLILPSLIVSGFAIAPPSIITGLLLIDIGQTFGSPVGVTGQLQTLYFIVGVVSALLLGALSVRFSNKSLLLMGVLSVVISSLGCGFALNFNMMLIFYSLAGSGYAIVLPMAFTLVADNFPLEKRSSVIGMVVAGNVMTYVIGAPVIGFIAGLGGWRMAFLGYALPVAFLGFLMASRGLPSISRGHQPTMSRENYLEGFKGVFSNRSAIACLSEPLLHWPQFSLLLSTAHRSSGNGS